MNEVQLLGKESSVHVQTVLALPKDYEDCAELLSSQHAKDYESSFHSIFLYTAFSITSQSVCN